MDQKSLDAIEESTIAITQAPVAALSGAKLTARLCWDALAGSSASNPISAITVSDTISQRTISPENVRQVIRALKAGGLPIESVKSKGYWRET